MLEMILCAKSLLQWEILKFVDWSLCILNLMSIVHRRCYRKHSVDFFHLLEVMLEQP